MSCNEAREWKRYEGRDDNGDHEVVEKVKMEHKKGKTETIHIVKILQIVK